MWVSRLVAFGARAGCLAELDAGRVACGAREGCVGAGQCEIGSRMVESFAVEPNDIEARSFVIGVAMLAVLAANRWVAAVVTAQRRNVGRNVLVTGKAELGLGFALPRFMALAALGFYFRVSAYDGSRQHHGFK